MVSTSPSADWLEQLCADFDLTVVREYRVFDDRFVYLFRDNVTQRAVYRWVVSKSEMASFNYEGFMAAAEHHINLAIKAAAEIGKVA